MEFSSNLRYLRRKNGLSQDELANKLGYKSFTTIQKWESGVSEPSVSTLKVIADIFSVSMDQMINDDLSVFSQPSSMSALPEQDRLLFENFHRLSDSQQAKLLAYLDGLLDAKDESKSAMNSLAEDAEREVDRIVAQELAAAKESKASIK